MNFKKLTSLLVIFLIFSSAEMLFSSEKNLQIYPREYNFQNGDIEIPTGFYLTEDELRFVSKNSTINVIVDPAKAPYEFFDPNSGKFYGLNVSVINKLFNKIGINPIFSIVPPHKGSKFIYFSQGNREIPELEDGSSFTTTVKSTKEVYSISLLLLSATEHEPFTGEKIALPPLDFAIKEKIYSRYPEDKYFFTEFESVSAAIESFKKGTTSYLICGSTEILNYPDLPKFSAKNMDIKIGQKISVSSNLADTFIPILNRAIESLTAEDLSILLYKGSIYKVSENFSFSSPKTFNLQIFFIILISATVLLLFVMLIFFHIVRGKNLSSDYDSITKISSYLKFERTSRNILDKAKSNEYIILSLNIDNFGFLNESLGVTKANQILAEIAKNFEKECKKDELVCRYYADNFIFLLKNPGFIWLIEERVFKLSQLTEKLKKLLPEQYELSFSSSVFYIEDVFQPVENMINKANLAQKMKKNNYATHRVVEYTKDIDQENEWNRTITLSMNKAMENDEFEVYFQPKFNFSTEKIVGAEALVRWNNPEKGFLVPGKFVPLFEHNGFIEKIDKYVFDNVCRFLSEWNIASPQKTCPAPLTISFNLSRQHLYNPNLIKELKSIANHYVIGSNQIEVELTESVMFDNPKRLVKVMNEIKKAGFSVSVDDFGSGYSSLNLLKDMPADVIKLDKEFLSSVPENSKESIIITSVIEMAKKLKITTVAEGVETKVQSDLLKEVGCDIAQGFYYAKPMPQNEFKKLLIEHYLE